MRTKNSIKNIIISILNQVIMIGLGFLSRKIFLDSLGVEYLGVNGLLENVISMLALVESGIGVSIVFHLYKPLAENDKDKITALIQLYKKAYTIIALIVLGLSFALYPFLGKLMKGNANIPYITVIYFLFIANNMTYYLNAHKVALINADQKGYVLARVNMVFQIFTKISKIFILLLTKNYILYLFIEFILFIIQNLYNGRIVRKRYPYIYTTTKILIEKQEKDSLIKNIKAIFLHNIGGYCVFGTDNLLIATFVGIKTVGFYSNYAMLIGQLEALLSSILSGIGGSIGNLIALESYDKRYVIFRVLNLVNFWIYSMSIVLLYNLLEPFINWWLGSGFLLDYKTFIILLVNFYINGLRSPILTFKLKGGIFVEDKYLPLIESILNLGASLFLVKYIGLAGIFLGTTISTLCTVFWYAPYLVYKNIFNKSVISYFKVYMYYSLITLTFCYVTRSLCQLIEIENNLLSLIAKGVVCIIVPNVLFVIIFFKGEEFKYIVDILKRHLVGVKSKLTSLNQ